MVLANRCFFPQARGTGRRQFGPYDEVGALEQVHRRANCLLWVPDAVSLDLPRVSPRSVPALFLHNDDQFAI